MPYIWGEEFYLSCEREREEDLSTTDECPECGRMSLHVGSYTCVCGNCGYSILVSNYQPMRSPVKKNGNFEDQEVLDVERKL
jgi:ribosomal protein L37E